MEHANQDMLFKMMADYSVQVLTNCWPVRIVVGGILVKHNDQDRTLPVEGLIAAAKMRPCNELRKTLTGKVGGLYTVGDCVKPRGIINAIWEAFHTARKIDG